jgi:type I restriction enzyme S subunit
VPGLSRESAYARPFVVPPAKLLSAFQDAVDPLGDEASALSAQADELATLRDLLLPKLVTGQIDVSSLELDATVGEQVA